MIHIPNLVGGLLGLLFITFGLMVLLKLGPTPPSPPEGSPVAHFMAAFAPTGYLTFVKPLEALVLGPIIVNILVAKGEGLDNPAILLIVAFALYLLWCGRSEFAGLLRNRPT